MPLYGVAVRNLTGFHVHDYWFIQAAWHETKEKAIAYANAVYGEQGNGKIEWKIIEVKTA